MNDTNLRLESTKITLFGYNLSTLKNILFINFFAHYDGIYTKWPF